MKEIREKLDALESVLYREFVSDRKRPTLKQTRDIWLTVAQIRSDAAKHEKELAS